MSGSIKGFHDVTILASNVPVLRSFYARIGLQEVFAQGEELVVFEVGTNEFALHASDAQPRAAVVLSFVVDNTSALEERLRSERISYEGPKPLRPGMVGISLKDPNDNVLEFLQRMQ